MTSPESRRPLEYAVWFIIGAIVLAALCLIGQLVYAAGKLI